MKVGVLAVQGAFAEMEAYWRAKGSDVFEIRWTAGSNRRFRWTTATSN